MACFGLSEVRSSPSSAWLDLACLLLFNGHLHSELASFASPLNTQASHRPLCSAGLCPMLKAGEDDLNGQGWYCWLAVGQNEVQGPMETEGGV